MGKYKRHFSVVIAFMLVLSVVFSNIKLEEMSAGTSAYGDLYAKLLKVTLLDSEQDVKSIEREILSESRVSEEQKEKLLDFYKATFSAYEVLVDRVDRGLFDVEDAHMPELDLIEEDFEIPEELEDEDLEEFKANKADEIEEVILSGVIHEKSYNNYEGEVLRAISDKRLDLSEDRKESLERIYDFKSKRLEALSGSHKVWLQERADAIKYIEEGLASLEGCRNDRESYEYTHLKNRVVEDNNSKLITDSEKSEYLSEIERILDTCGFGGGSTGGGSGSGSGGSGSGNGGSDRPGGGSGGSGSGEDKPGIGGEDKPGTGGEDKPSTGGEDKPGIGGEDKPSTGGEDKPSTGGEDKPGTGGEDKPSTGGEDKPSTGGEDKPGTGGEEKPGTGGEDKPGTGGEDKPGVGGEDKPGTGGDEKPGTDKPGTEKPGTDKPGTGGEEKPGTDTDKPGTGGDEKPGTDKPGTEKPGTDKPGTGGSDKPGVNNPGTNKPGTGNPNVVKPGVDNPTIVNPGVDTPTIDLGNGNSNVGDTNNSTGGGTADAGENPADVDVEVDDVNKIGSPVTDGMGDTEYGNYVGIVEDAIDNITENTDKETLETIRTSIIRDIRSIDDRARLADKFNAKLEEHGLVEKLGVAYITPEELKKHPSIESNKELLAAGGVLPKSGESFIMYVLLGLALVVVGKKVRR